MDRYTKVEQKKPDIPINENEIRITSQGLVRNYISYATTLIQERRGKEIVLKAMGQAISKTVAIAEIIKRNIPRLHQDTNISSISITDVWEPIEEGLLPVEMTRLVSMISITLSTKELNKNSPGYQAPLYVERPRPQYNNYQRQQQPQQAYNEEPYGGGYHGNRGRGQGGGIRGGRGRGWNRGGYGHQGGGYGSYQGGDRYRNYQGGGGDGYKNYQGGGGDGYTNYQAGGGYGSYQGGKGYGNYRGGRGYGNYQGGGGDEYANYQGSGEYGNNQYKNGYLNNGRGGGRGGYAGYRGGGYMRGGSGGRGGGGGRFNGRGRGRMGGRPRDGGDPQQQ